jgi:hypothetical protein
MINLDSVVKRFRQIVPPPNLPVPKRPLTNFITPFQSQPMSPIGTTPNLTKPPPLIPSARRSTDDGKLDRILDEINQPTTSTIKTSIDPRMEHLKRRDPQRFNEIMHQKPSPTEASTIINEPRVSVNQGGEEDMEIEEPLIEVGNC